MPNVRCAAGTVKVPYADSLDGIHVAPRAASRAGCSKGSWSSASRTPLRARRTSAERSRISASWELSDKGKRARFYRLTPAGRKQLAAEQSKWQAFSRAMGLILNPADQEGQ